MDIPAVLKDLMQIAKIPQDAKLRTRSGSLSIDEWTLLQAFMRRIYGEDRAQTLEKLDKIYNQAMTYSGILEECMPINRILIRNELTTLEYAQYNTEKVSFQELYDWMEKSLKGLKNLEETYHSELTELNLIQGKVTKHLVKAKDKLDILEKRERQIHIIDRNRPESIKAEHRGDKKKKSD